MSLAAELDKLWSEVWARGRLDIPGTKVPFFLQLIFICFRSQAGCQMAVASAE